MISALSMWPVRMHDMDYSSAQIQTMLTRCNPVKQCAKFGIDERFILGVIMQESHGNVATSTEYS
jgi:hypothetical protein